MIRAAGVGYWLAGAVLAVSLHGATVLVLTPKAPPATPPAPDGGFVVELAEIETARPDSAPDLSLGEDMQAQQAVAATTEMPEMAPPPEPDPVPEDIARPDPVPDRRPDRPAPPRQPARPEISESRTTHMVAATQDVVNRAKRQAVAPRKPDPQAVSAWMHALELALQRHKQYPESARRDRAEGRVILRLALGAKGNVVNVSVLSSSEFELLDQAALDLVNAAGPFPTPPALGANGQLRIRVPIDYALK
ncbi:TonB family protein [Thalassovita aquimarina]|uniref:TonB family protein n=1 Tax=Thalassovita aquimarina TaxID=2785917 RepID=UPI0035676EE2